MKIAFPIDGLLCDTDGLSSEWARRLGDDFKRDESFWAGVKPFEDSFELINNAVQNKWDFYVFACRPKAFVLPTRAWLRNTYGLNIEKDRLVMDAIKRYDCRLREIQIFIDSDLKAIENLAIETVVPIRTYHVDRSMPSALLTIIEELNEGYCR